jgi:AcrR family transcriptional regulator
MLGSSTLSGHGWSVMAGRHVTRRRVEVRREEILDATLEVVTRLGLAATRVADVASALGVSPGLVFYHFGTKDSLLAEAFAHAVQRDLDRLDAALARGRDPVTRLRRVLTLYGPTGSAQGWQLWIDAWSLAQREPVIRSVLRTMDRRWCRAIRAVVEEGVADGSFTCADPEASVAKVSALLDGLSVATLVYRTVTRAQLRRWVAEAIATEVGLDPAELS